jgi:hypothetical protein
VSYSSFTQSGGGAVCPRTWRENRGDRMQTREEPIVGQENGRPKISPKVEVFSPFQKPFSKANDYELTPENTTVVMACFACCACTACTACR